VKIDGIPSPVSAPAPDRSTWRRVPIPPGVKGTKAELEIIAALAREAVTDPFFVEEARSIVRGVRGRDYQGEAAAILGYVREMTDYRHDPIGVDEVDRISSPGYLLFVDPQGDCDDMVALVCALNLGVGHGCMIRAVRLDPNREDFSHVYALAGIPGPGGPTWLGQDAVTSFPLGWEPPREDWVGESLDLVVAFP
jgi:hypothetical protein